MQQPVSNAGMSGIEDDKLCSKPGSQSQLRTGGQNKMPFGGEKRGCRWEDRTRRPVVDRSRRSAFESRFKVGKKEENGNWILGRFARS